MSGRPHPEDPVRKGPDCTDQEFRAHAIESRPPPATLLNSATLEQILQEILARYAQEGKPFGMILMVGQREKDGIQRTVMGGGDVGCIRSMVMEQSSEYAREMLGKMLGFDKRTPAPPSDS